MPFTVRFKVSSNLELKGFARVYKFDTGIMASRSGNFKGQAYFMKSSMTLQNVLFSSHAFEPSGTVSEPLSAPRSE